MKLQFKKHKQVDCLEVVPDLTIGDDEIHLFLNGYVFLSISNEGIIVIRQDKVQPLTHPYRFQIVKSELK